MNKEQFEKYLESIGGLENGYFPNKPPIKSRYFFSVNDGWLQLLKDMIEELVANGWDKQICDVKEKFGGLRFYTNAVNSKCQDIVSKYESLSFKTCETCGEPGEVRPSAWILTLCDKCYNNKTKT